MKSFLFLALCLGAVAAPFTSAADAPWSRHAIDDTSKGADGVRPADVNGDGLPDFTVAWEEGNVIRVYLHPGHAKVREPWPRATVGNVRKPEDAVFVDLDNDGRMDVVSSCEKGTEAVFAHFAPPAGVDYLDESKWRTEMFPATHRRTMWMWALPFDMDGRNGVDLVVGSKTKDAMVGWLEAPENPRDMAAWKLHHLRDAGWIMNLLPIDLDGDGDRDVLLSDRMKKGHGVVWLENPGPTATAKGDAWREHVVEQGRREYTFLSYAPVGRDAQPAIACATAKALLIFRRGDGPDVWKCEEIPLPEGVGFAKSLVPGDLDGDGDADLVFTCEKADGPKTGVMWMEYVDNATGSWKPRTLGGPEGTKFDRAELIDLDRDGDLDVVTCEERDLLGVVWYENPFGKPKNAD
jgi:hypothetical protein